MGGQVNILWVAVGAYEFIKSVRLGGLALD